MGSEGGESRVVGRAGGEEWGLGCGKGSSGEKGGG